MVYGAMVEGVWCYGVWCKGNGVMVYEEWCDCVTCDREWCEWMVYDISLVETEVHFILIFRIVNINNNNNLIVLFSQ